MVAKSIMIQGTGSNVGKSVLVAGLARAFCKRGLTVAPFKPQNMSNNAAVTIDGGEIGRAQALQALACGLEPITDMNPVLLKPESEKGAQVILQGQRIATVKARDYSALKPKLLSKTLESFARLKAQADLVLVEGAGSPAEVNLRAGDIANMGFAEAANLPVVLAGDIDRGGVIAQLVGTKAVLSAQDASRIKAFLVNKFRGDVSLFDDGVTLIEAETNWPCLGVVPWFAQAHQLPAEDANDLQQSNGKGRIKIAVPQLSRIANFDDLDPLSLEPEVNLVMVPAGQPLPLDADLILLPGTKSTMGDLAFLRAQGWDVDLAAHIRRGGQVLGICGGYQMLGETINDPDGIEGPAGQVKGLGHLAVHTTMTPQKTLSQITGVSPWLGTPVRGYEIHIGRTSGPDTARAWLEFGGQAHGAASVGGQIRGCYCHGLFADDAFRSAYLSQLSTSHQQGLNYSAAVEQTLDALAQHLETHLDLDQMLALAQ